VIFKAFGPAGTGKTETLKDFSQLCGKDSVVINCSPELTLSDIQSIMKDRSSETAYILDEVNRVDEKN